MKHRTEKKRTLGKQQGKQTYILWDYFLFGLGIVSLVLSIIIENWFGRLIEDCKHDSVTIEKPYY